MNSLKTLSEIRREIDTIDDSLIKLLENRMIYANEVAQYKKNNGLPVNIPERENDIIQKVKNAVKEEYFENIKKIYIEIMAQSKKIQELIIEESPKVDRI